MFPVSSYRFPVQPPESDPDSGDLVCVTFSRDWLPFVIGSLSQLMQATTWKTDVVPLEDTINRVGDLINLFSSVSCMYITNIRVNGCLIEAQFGGSSTWELIGTVAPCARGEAQDVINENLDAGTLTGAPQQGPIANPSTFTCYTFQFQLNGNDKWICPLALNYGDTLQVVAAEGGWNDGGSVAWACPSGQQYVLGSCGSAMGLVSGDPLPTVDHMKLIGYDGTAYKDMYLQTYTALGTVQYFLQANDSAIANNLGSVQLRVEVCVQSSAATWCVEVDFTTSDGGFTKADGSSSNHAEWQSGVGWTGSYGIFADVYISRGNLFGVGISRLIDKWEWDIEQVAVSPTQHGYLIGPNGQTDNGGHFTTSPVTLVQDFGSSPFLANQITFDANAGTLANGCSMVIKRFRLYGKGNPPIGYTLCP